MILYTTLAAIGMTAGLSVKGYAIYKQWGKRQQAKEKNKILSDMIEQIQFEEAIGKTKEAEKELSRTFTETILTHPHLFEKEIQELVNEKPSKTYTTHFQHEHFGVNETPKKKEKQRIK